MIKWIAEDPKQKSSNESINIKVCKIILILVFRLINKLHFVYHFGEYQNKYYNESLIHFII